MADNKVTNLAGMQGYIAAVLGLLLCGIFVEVYPIRHK